MKVVLCEPGRRAKVAEIGSSLSDMQAVVGGYIEAVYPFDDDVALVCNEEGKIEGLPLNRAIVLDGKVEDIIAGTFFICGLGEEDFTSLTDEQVKRYSELFYYPKTFGKVNGRICVIPILDSE